MSDPRGTLHIVGIGPGARDHTTPAALAAIADAEVVVGYTTYIKLVRHLLDGKHDSVANRAASQDRKGSWAERPLEK